MTKLQDDELIIRGGAASELDAAWTIWSEACIAAGRGPGSAATLGRIKHRLSRESTALFFAVRDDEIVGVTMLAQACDKLRKGAPIEGLGHISTVAVKPAFWGRGIAQALLAKALREASLRKYRRVQLWVNGWNTRGMRLYEYLGFSKTADQQLDDYGKVMYRYEVILK